MLRRLVESISMALLCADEPSQVFESLTADPEDDSTASVAAELAHTGDLCT
jgi:hypothetical protein